MKTHRLSHLFFIGLLCLFLFLLTGCSGGGSSREAASSFSPGKTSVLVPASPGTKTLGGDPLLLDISNVEQGYFTGILKKNDSRINIQVLGPDGITYKYFLEEADVETVFPLTAGNGTYTIMAFENVSEDQYASLFAEVFDVELSDEFLPFLYPNQFVNFDENSRAAALAAELTAEVTSDLEALTVIYEYVISHISYDNEKAATVSGNYLPDIDATLASGTGICFDYASLTTAMLRSVGIPAKLAIGYSGDIRHAWIDVYIQSMGWVEKAIEFKGDEWKLMDPTFASTGTDESILEYIGDGDNYILEYER